MESESVTDWIALNLLPGLGGVLAQRALERFEEPGRIAYRVSADALRSIRGVGDRKVGEILEARKTLARRAEREWRRCRRHGVDVLPITHPDYPAALETLPDAPVLLYVRGQLLPGVARIGVVGSRNPTNYGRKVATGLAGGLAVRGVEVVSGGARGVDTCAHRAALAEEGRTIAVLGSGVLEPYPDENRDLFDEIGAAGAVVSEFPLTMPPQAEHFPRRNRLISGLSAGVVVVEATLRSGSLVTARHALEQNREVLAVPGPVSSPRSEGCNRLIQQGAKLVQNIEDIVEELSPMYRVALPGQGAEALDEPPPDVENLTLDETAVLGILDEVEPIHLDDLAQRAPFGIGRLQAALMGLELRSAVEQTPGRYYVSRPSRGPRVDGTSTGHRRESG